MSFLLSWRALCDTFIFRAVVEWLLTGGSVTLSSGMGCRGLLTL
jgi:hypothetical protein